MLNSNLDPASVYLDFRQELNPPPCVVLLYSIAIRRLKETMLIASSVELASAPSSVSQQCQNVTLPYRFPTISYAFVSCTGLPVLGDGGGGGGGE